MFSKSRRESLSPPLVISKLIRPFFIILAVAWTSNLVRAFVTSPIPKHWANLAVEHSSSISVGQFDSPRPLNTDTNTDEAAIASTMLSCKDSTQKAFQGKTVLLTGASGGLGRALALQLAGCGVQTLILSARSEKRLQEIARECETFATHQLDTHCIACDLSNPDSVNQLAQKALQICPTIDVLINNGGVSSRSRFLDTQFSVDQQVMQINFLSGAALAKAIIPAMVKQGSGRLIWISSVQGLVGIPNRSSYAASKFAVQGYCESLRAELSSSGVTVHCVSPGYIRTNLSRAALTGDGTQHGQLDETTAAGADPEQVAVTILDKVAAGQADFCVAATFSAVAAIWMRLLCPSLLRYLLVKRYEKSQKQKVD